MHFAGLQGMPRRIYTYQPGRGLDTFNLIESIGALVQGIAVLIFVINVVRSLGLRRRSRRRPVGRLDAGMVHDLATARVQLRRTAGGAQPAAAVGSQTSGRPRLEVRMMAAAPAQSRRPRRTRMAHHAAATRARWHPGADSYRVSVLLNLRRRLHLLPRQKPDRPLSQRRPFAANPEHHLPAVEQHHDRARDPLSPRRLDPRFPIWWFITFALGLEFLIGTAMEWHHLIYHDGLTIRTNLFGTTYYSLVGLHALHVTVGLLLILLVLILTMCGYMNDRHVERTDVPLLVLALRRCRVGSSISDGVRDWPMR